jgi:hypothetical protein
MAKEEEERKLVFSKFYKICIVILIVLGIIVSPVYPELMMRFFIGIILAIGVFFGFGTNEAHCEYVYKYIKINIDFLFIKFKWSLGCRSRMFAMLVSIACYIFAVFVGFQLKVI